MRRTAGIWSIFAAALVLVLTVMAFLTVKMLQFEKAVAAADARATTEERIRLALWRMDSAAAVLLAEKPRRALLANGNARNFDGNNAYANSSNSMAQSAQRSNPEFQQQLSINEYQQRAAVTPPATEDWHKIAPVLLDRVSDILDGAKLEPVAKSQTGVDDTRRLASIPARLVVPPSAFAPPVLPWNTPLRISLMIAWTCAIIAAAAVAMLLGGALALSERRGAFVSAVTHELRTPLTTFRMYAEMLAGGMVAEPDARQQYLDTLVSESDRLGHLIENVLAYARLERKLSPSRAQLISVGDLLDRTLPALRRRAQQAELPLDLEMADDVAGMQCRTDTIAVQQILVNLVDNACKYGRSRMTLSVAAVGGQLEFRVADSGPGISAAAAGKLFSAFSKSMTDTVPGIGLGLFLSRRLARALDGELEYIPTPSGATFSLRLPMAA